MCFGLPVSFPRFLRSLTLFTSTAAQVVVFFFLFFSFSASHIPCGGGHDSLSLVFFYVSLSICIFVLVFSLFPFVFLFHRMCMSCLSCVCGLFRPFYPSTFSTTSVRADSPILEEKQVTTQSYATFFLALILRDDHFISFSSFFRLIRRIEGVVWRGWMTNLLCSFRIA